MAPRLLPLGIQGEAQLWGPTVAVFQMLFVLEMPIGEPARGWTRPWDLNRMEHSRGGACWGGGGHLRLAEDEALGRSQRKTQESRSILKKRTLGPRGGGGRRLPEAAASCRGKLSRG